MGFDAFDIDVALDSAVMRVAHEYLPCDDRIDGGRVMRNY